LHSGLCVQLATGTGLPLAKIWYWICRLPLLSGTKLCTNVYQPEAVMHWGALGVNSGPGFAKGFSDAPFASETTNAGPVTQAGAPASPGLAVPTLKILSWMNQPLLSAIAESQANS
jgi:hypothetical protein